MRQQAQIPAGFAIGAAIDQDALLRQNFAGGQPLKLGMGGEEAVHHCLVFRRQDAAGRIHQPSTRLDQARSTGEDVALFLGEFGVTLVGILGVLFFVSVMTGLILWWPLTGKWRRVLTIKRKASPERFNHDLHQTAGFYSAIVLLALLVSGIYFNLPDQFRWLVGQFSTLMSEPKPFSASQATATTAVLDQAIQQALKQYPGGDAQYYSFTPDKNGLFTACFRNVPSLKPYVLDSRCFQINRANGQLLALADPAHGSGGDVFMQWQWPLHSGQVFGWTGRILVFITGLLCPLLFVTGVIRWLQKRRAKRRMSV